MPSTSTLFWTSLPILLAAFVYQVGVPAPILKLWDEILVIKILKQLFVTTYCYKSVRTHTNGLPLAECFTVSGNKFSNVFLDTTSFDVVKEGRSGHVIPGLWDGHGHLMQYGELLDSANLFGAENMDEVKTRLGTYKKSRDEVGTSEQWLRGVGWDQASFEGKWPTAADLEIGDQFKDLYVMLDRVDVHCIWVSNKVLSLLPSPLPNVPGGEMPAKGVFCDNAMDIVLKYYPKPSKERKTKFIKDAMYELNKLGIVGVHDAGVVPSDLALYEELSKDQDWSLRVYAMAECDVRNTLCLEDVKKITTSSGNLHVRSVKLFADGALGSWGSAMIEPYSDKETSSGSLLVNATTLTSLTKEWATAGYQVNIHAIGDMANRLAIDAFEAAFKTLCPDLTPHMCQTKHRFRIEHSQIIHPDDQKRMREIGIIPSIQPTHATSDMPYAEKRLGPIRTQEEAYRMRSLLPLNPVLGSDFPVEPANIFQGVYAAITRRNPSTGLDANGKTKGWYTEETLTLEDALDGFTINPAYAAHLEGQTGSIEIGAYADWVVLDEPLETMDLESLRTATVKETWVGGKMVWRRPGPEEIPWLRNRLEILADEPLIPEGARPARPAKF
ncbi:amidohydrolase 3 [Pleomassaria siparia CBS 279.74]|uniref:Amidohydrolase 3 n=1 Tax=Pleomassaria siparia CBS 279.74 TaxID=1314801 RepID=A0A6G1K5A7_9PLEO|nr:amidohydrolase 3 [Pleomassaria siparia CBS 279.74]